jgi:hypothetical protein
VSPGKKLFILQWAATIGLLVLVLVIPLKAHTLSSAPLLLQVAIVALACLAAIASGIRRWGPQRFHYSALSWNTVLPGNGTDEDFIDDGGDRPEELPRKQFLAARKAAALPKSSASQPSPSLSFNNWLLLAALGGGVLMLYLASGGQMTGRLWFSLIVLVAGIAWKLIFDDSSPARDRSDSNDLGELDFPADSRDEDYDQEWRAEARRLNRYKRLKHRDNH